MRICSKLLLLLALGYAAVASASPYVFKESDVPGFLKNGVPRLDEIEATMLQTQVDLKSKDEKFGLEGYVGGSYSENKARALLDFIPVYSPTRTGEFGVRKNTAYGVSTSLGAAVEQVTGRTPNFTLRNGTTTVLKLSASIDLWQDIFGRASRAEMEQLSLATERAEIEKTVNTRAFVLSLRRIYWSLVANKLSMDITKSLLDQSQQQAKDARNRSANYVADSAEVARYEANVSSRLSSLTALNYQRENLIKSLVSLVPELNGREIELSVNSVDSTIQEVLACTNIIGSREQTPYDFTKYDEVLSLLKREKSLRLKAIDRSGGPSLQLTGDYKTTGVDRGLTHKGNIGGSINDFTDNNRQGFTVALNAVIPLDGKKSDTERTKELLEQHRFDADIRGMEANVGATHHQLKNNVKLLVEIIRNQKRNSELLRKRLGIEKKKYSQARISVVDLINDQDALLSAELDVVSAQLQIMNNLFDYLTVFTETPCDFNRNI